jgi:ribosomal protein S18 acetylase RimI-like enzyme
MQTRIRLLEQNLAGHLSWLPRATAGMAVQDGDGWLLVRSGLPCDSFNVLFCWGRPSDTALEGAVSGFRSQGLPFAAWVGPESPAAAVLERLGLRPAEVEVGMLLDGADFRTVSLPDGLTVERVTDPVRLAHFAGVLAGQPADASVVRFYELTQSAALRPDSPVRLFVGYAGGQPVACAEAFLSDGVVGVYGVATLVPYRRRGIGTAMTARAVEEGFRAGARLAVLQAAPDGRGIYERLGFRSACEFTILQ